MTRDELYNFWRFEETFPFSGWDFAHLDGRWEQEPLPWDFYAEVQRRLHYADQLLEVDTGGAFLLSLRHPYENTAVTETWGPNVESYRNELAPLGIHVEECDAAEEPLPFADNAFDVAFCRHGAYRADELLRVLRPGGCLLYTSRCVYETAHVVLTALQRLIRQCTAHRVGRRCDFGRCGPAGARCCGCACGSGRCTGAAFGPSYYP